MCEYTFDDSCYDETDSAFQKIAKLTYSPFSNWRNYGYDDDITEKMCESDFAPPLFKGETKQANLLIALEIARRLGVPLLSVLYGLKLSHGEPALSFGFAQCALYACKRFARFKFVHEYDDDTLVSCQFQAYEKYSGDDLEGQTVTRELIHDLFPEMNVSLTACDFKKFVEQLSVILFIKEYAPDVLMGFTVSLDALNNTPEQKYVITPKSFTATVPLEPDTPTQPQSAQTLPLLELNSEPGDDAGKIVLSLDESDSNRNDSTQKSMAQNEVSQTVLKLEEDDLPRLIPFESLYIKPDTETEPDATPDAVPFAKVDPVILDYLRAKAGFTTGTLPESPKVPKSTEPENA